MHTFRVEQSPGGWCVRVGEGATSPCRSRTAAIAQAERMAEAIRRHGEIVQILMEPAGADDAADRRRFSAALAARLRVKRITPRQRR